jgi:uncharacterized protein
MSQTITNANEWEPLEPLQRRILGVLIEKSKTTPDSYPLSLNALATGCNQKSNRDPILDLEDEEVEQALPSLQKRGLVSRVAGGRVDRWRHHAYEAWSVGRVELGILAELLLRGPQTEGELRTRVSRMDAISDLDSQRATLKELVRRGLVVWLDPEGRRGAQITHGFYPPAELETLKSGTGRHDEVAEVSSAKRLEADSAINDRVTALEARVRELAEQLESLRKAVGG